MAELDPSAADTTVEDLVKPKPGSESVVDEPAALLGCSSDSVY